MKVVIAARNRFERFSWPGWATPKLRAEFPDVEFVEVQDATVLPAALRDATVMIGPLRSAAALQAATALRWVHTPTAAVHDLLFPEMVASPVVLTNGSSVHGSPVAEHALAMMLALSRNIPEAVRYQVRHEWGQSALGRAAVPVGELRDSTVVLVGLGEIGRVLALLLQALQATVLGVRRHAAEAVPGCNEVHPPAALPALLPRADYVVLAVPVTSDTRALIGDPQLALLRPSARLVNVGRGELVDESALLAALNSGRLAGAALDVFQHEPLPPESPLWDARNLLITPHIAGITEASWSRQVDVVIDNLHRFRRGEPLLYVVDKSRGY